MTYHHLSVLVHRQAEKYGEKTALRYRDYQTAQWIPISWNQFSKTVRQAANSLVALGVQEEENIGIFSQNKPECLFTDFAAFANRAVTIPLYATSSPAQAQYIINDAQIRILFVGEQFQYDAAFSVFGFCPSLQQIIIFDRSVVKDRRDVSSIYFDDFLAMVKDCLIMMWWKNVLHALRKTIWPIFYILPVRRESPKESCCITLASLKLSAFMIFVWWICRTKMCR